MMKGFNLLAFVLFLSDSAGQNIRFKLVEATDGVDGNEAIGFRKHRFNSQLPPFGESVVEPYETCREMRDDIKTALEIFVDNTIDSELRTSRCRDNPPSNDGSSDDFDEGKRNLADGFYLSIFGVVGGGEEGGNGPSGGTSAGASREDSFGTHNVVEGVDEADAVKSDGTFIFTKYGREVVMTNFLGDVIDRVTVFPEQQNPPKVESLLFDPEAKTITAITSRDGSAAHVYSYKAEKLELAGRIDIPGFFVKAQSIASKAHIITSVRMPQFRKIHRCNSLFHEMKDDQYETAAFSVAKIIIPLHVDKVMESIGVGPQDGDEACQGIARITSMTNAGEDSAETEEDRLLDLTGGRGLLQKLVHVTTFDMSEYEALGSDNMKVESAGIFVPKSGTEVFLGKEVIVIAARGFRRRRGQGRFNAYEEFTFLTKFEFQANYSKVIPTAVGQVQGYLLNKYSIDVFDGIVRLATTNVGRWVYTESRWRYVFRSGSRVSKLEFDDDGKMRLVGQLDDLGVRERFYSVGFDRRRGYVVLAGRTPIFMIDMMPDTPVMLGEIKIKLRLGSYILKPIGEAENYLLGIGAGHKLEISLFDVSDPGNPREAHTHTVRDGGGFTFSDAGSDFKAIRYLPASKKLILPGGVHGFGSRNFFRGFFLFDIDVETGIIPTERVTHVDNTTILNRVCYSNVNLSSRSLVSAGNLVTLQGHIVKYSLGPDEEESNLDEGRDGRFVRCYAYNH